MEELKKQTMNIIKNVNEDWVKALKDSEASGEGVDTTEMFGKFTAHIDNLDKYFREAGARNKKKKGMFS